MIKNQNAENIGIIVQYLQEYCPLAVKSIDN
jgi:hypothetical protein